MSSLLGENINAILRNTKALLNASKEVGLEVNAEKIKDMLMIRRQNTGQEYHHIKAS
jgi:hypothetical protein